MVRTCIGCRARRPSEQLIRLVVEATGAFVVDAGDGLPGRGLHLCPRRSCFSRAHKQRAFARALAGTPMAEVVVEDIWMEARRAHEEQLRRLVAGARRAGLVSGRYPDALSVINPRVRHALERRLEVVASLSG